MFVVCKKKTQGAIPLFDSIGGSEILYVTESDEAIPAEILKEIEQHGIKNIISYDISAFQGFVAGMKYDEDIRTESLPFEEKNAVIENGRLLGAVTVGTFYSWEGYNSDPLDTAKEYSQSILLPKDSSPVQTEYYRSITIYGSDGEEDDYIRYTHSMLVKKEKQKCKT